jgi:hypothetical protein
MSSEDDQAFADLLSAVIERHAVASRLQGTEALAESALAAAMRVGDGVRRARRGGPSDRPNADDCAQLARLASELDEATDAVLRDAPAVALRRAAAAGDGASAAGMALGLFLGLERPQRPPERVYVGIRARRRSRTGETLVHPADLADEIVRSSAEGLGPESGVTAAAEEPLLPEPIALAPTFAASGSEVALVRSTAGIADALLEDAASGDLVLFVARLPGPFSVALARDADDEWWAASALSYADYRAQLAAELRARGVGAELLA